MVLEGGERLDYGVCVWSTGNAARPLVQAVAGAVPVQREALAGRNPAAAKLTVDPFLRIAGVRDAIALGDCSRLSGAPLPATAQVRAPSAPAQSIVPQLYPTLSLLYQAFLSKSFDAPADCTQ